MSESEKSWHTEGLLSVLICLPEIWGCFNFWESVKEERVLKNVTLLQNQSMWVQQKKASFSKAIPKPPAIDSTVKQAVKERPSANPKKQITYVESCHSLF